MVSVDWCHEHGEHASGCSGCKAMTEHPTDATSFAWTATSDYRCYPQFINVQRGPDGVRISVRSPEDMTGEHPATGSQAVVTIPESEAAALADYLRSPSTPIDDEGLRLREALKPFSECADSYAEQEPDSRQVIEMEPGIRIITLGDLRRARAAIEAKPNVS